MRRATDITVMLFIFTLIMFDAFVLTPSEMALRAARRASKRREVARDHNIQ